MDNYENSSKTGYTPPIKPRLVDDGTPEEKPKETHKTTWPETVIWLGFFVLVGWIFQVIFK